MTNYKDKELALSTQKIISKIKKEILSCLKTDGFKNIKEAIGKDV